MNYYSIIPMSEIQIGLDKMNQSPQRISQVEMGNIQLQKRPIRQVHEQIIENILKEGYENYKQRRQTHSHLQKIRRVLNFIGSNLLMTFRALWFEIVPQYVRGIGQVALPTVISLANDLKGTEFSQFRKKRNHFFMIVMCGVCDQHEIQQAYQRASFMVNDGFSISKAELKNNTNLEQWQIPSLKSDNKYIILFMRFTCFGDLLNFGEITFNYIQQNLTQETDQQHFKDALQFQYSHYDKLEQSFIGSYIQKQERYQFQ